MAVLPFGCCNQCCSVVFQTFLHKSYLIAVAAGFCNANVCVTRQVNRNYLSPQWLCVAAKPLSQLSDMTVSLQVFIFIKSDVQQRATPIVQQQTVITPHVHIPMERRCNYWLQVVLCRYDTLASFHKDHCRQGLKKV